MAVADDDTEIKEDRAEKRGVRWLSVNSSWRCDSNMTRPVLAYFLMEPQPTTGDAVPGPLAFFALRQQHGMKARRWHHADGTGHATGLPRGSGCLPAEPYPPQQYIQTIGNVCRRQGQVRATHASPLPCYWPKAINAGGLGAEPPKDVGVREN